MWKKTRKSFKTICWQEPLRQLGRKAPISFDFRKYVEKHCNGPWWVYKEIQKRGDLQHKLLLFLIWLTSFDDDWKVIKKQIDQSKVYVYEKCYINKKVIW